jgi:hypothetical protein
VNNLQIKKKRTAGRWLSAYTISMVDITNQTFLHSLKTHPTIQPPFHDLPLPQYLPSFFLTPPLRTHFILKHPPPTSPLQSPHAVYGTCFFFFALLTIFLQLCQGQNTKTACLIMTYQSTQVHYAERIRPLYAPRRRGHLFTRDDS